MILKLQLPKSPILQKLRMKDVVNRFNSNRLPPGYCFDCSNTKLVAFNTKLKADTIPKPIVNSSVRHKTRHITNRMDACGQLSNASTNPFSYHCNCFLHRLDLQLPLRFISDLVAITHAPGSSYNCWIKASANSTQNNHLSNDFVLVPFLPCQTFPCRLHSGKSLPRLLYTIDNINLKPMGRWRSRAVWAYV